MVAVAPSGAPLPERRAPRGSLAAQTQLTAREREVATLVAQGFTNRQIAEALVITAGTAAIHVEHIRNKLDVHTRAQIASWVTAQGWAADA